MMLIKDNMIIISIIGILILFSIRLSYSNNAVEERNNILVENVKAGKRMLYCHFDDGYHLADPSNVKALTIEGWEFHEGSGNDCIIAGEQIK